MSFSQVAAILACSVALCNSSSVSRCAAHAEYSLRSFSQYAPIRWPGQQGLEEGLHSLPTLPLYHIRRRCRSRQERPLIQCQERRHNVGCYVCLLPSRLVSIHLGSPAPLLRGESPHDTYSLLTTPCPAVRSEQSPAHPSMLPTARTGIMSSLSSTPDTQKWTSRMSPLKQPRLFLGGKRKKYIIVNHGPTQVHWQDWRRDFPRDDAKTWRQAHLYVLCRDVHLQSGVGTNMTHSRLPWRCHPTRLRCHLQLKTLRLRPPETRARSRPHG